MSFFIAGRTKCGICQLPVAHRDDAGRLAWVSPADLPELAPMVRGFVHRTCWAGWPQAERFSLAAVRLITEGDQPDSGPIRVGGGDRFAILRVPGASDLRIQDFALLLDVDIPDRDRSAFADFIRRCGALQAGDIATV